MSLITRCPACGTMFKVVPDQLKISDGWVRCGHCGEVFDARANLFDPEAVPPPAPSPGEPPAFEPFAPEPVAMSTTNASAGVGQPDLVDDRFAAAAFDPAPAESKPSAVPQPDISLDTDAEWISLDEPVLSRPAPLADAHQVAGPTAGRAPAMALRDEGDEDDDDLDSQPAEPPPAFVRQADRRAFWRRPAVRFVLSLLLLALALGLLGQAAFQERDRIATMWPEARPVLEQLCRPIDCKVGALKRIDAIAVEGSSFNRARGDVYRLSILLKNNAALDLAMPSVELTLTDTQDQAVIRRVLTPADMGAGDKLAAGVEWNGNMAISVAAQAGASRVAGYRVIAFYP